MSLEIKKLNEDSGKAATNPPHDFIKWNQNEILPLNVEELCRLKRELAWTLGVKRAAALITRWGYSCGQSDGLALIALKKEPPSEEALSYSTPRSLEAEAYIYLNDNAAPAPQCHHLAGYLTGFFSARFGEPILFEEEKCRAQGYKSCQFSGHKFSSHENPVNDLAALFKEDNLGRELEEALDQLKQTKDRYQNLFEYSNVPIFIVDPDSGAFLNMNMAASELSGYTKQELLGMNVFDLCRAEFHSKIAEAVKKLVGEGRVEDQEIKIQKKDSTVRHISQSSKILSYGGRQVIQAALRDITDLKISEQKEKELQEKLIKSDRLSSIGRLAANVAHELKNPLGAIKNALYYIKTSLANSPVLEVDPHLKEILKLAEGEVDTSVTIIGELLDFSRVVTLSPRKTQINEIVRQLPKILLVPDNLRIELDLDQNLPIAFVDPDRMKQVFCNLANNGMQSMPHGGVLKIITTLEVASIGKEEKEESFINVEFEDSGVGIDPDFLTKIFEPLFTTKAQGTGLGLAICNNIVEKAGGKISVVSQKGKGSRFTVRIPMDFNQNKEEK